MPRSPLLSPSALTLQMQAQGLATAQRLAGQLGVNRSTVSRGLATLGDEVLRIGAARRARYGLRRSVRNLGSRWPLYRIDDTGRAHEFGVLRSAHGGCLIGSDAMPGWLEREYPDGVFPGLPFFLSDVRPQGFIGRAIARSLNATGRFPTDPRDWQEDDVLAYLVTQGSDTPGDWIVGDAMLEAAHLQDHFPVVESARTEIYTTRANAAMQGEITGSSAAGEQPKFSAWVGAPHARRAVLVKFSPPLDSASGRRWSDLLVAESIAAEVLAAQGHAAVRTELLDGGNRRFLEITRFDRVGARGRRGVITLQAVEAGLVSEAADNWPAVADALVRANLLSAEAATALRQRWCFGRLIANSDMHLGNAALWFESAAPLSLAPCYDMLPMLYASSPQGEVIPREFRLTPPQPALRADWEHVRPWAVGFWQRVEADARISEEFRQIAAVNVVLARDSAR